MLCLQIDVFSFAMTIYELLTLYKPYELLSDIKASISFNDVVTRKERPSITGKVHILVVKTYLLTI